ncbi:Translation initiation factor 2 subunit beta [Candidatus Gugararchaeum adminiculabundum]|nr:Translation initiation factor 2 subunit beta [Candidatus Gugararchaeum adminiculabundum]
MDDYEKLLDKAYANLPKKVLTQERFEMPAVDSFIQGTKTIVKNFDFVCQKLRRDPNQVAKYLYKELAAPGSVQGQRLMLQGKFGDKMLNEKLENYAKTYVLCKECGKPDTNLIEEGNRIHTLVCEACGARAPARGV